jgi:serine protease Do
MKQVFSTVAAGVVGGALVLGATHFWNGNQSSTIFSGKAGSNPNARTVEYYGKPKAPFDFTEAAAKTMSAVVHIRSKATPQQSSNNRMGDQDLWEFLYGRGGGFGGGGVREGVGSGVIIRNDGYIVTNNHVVKDATELEVTLFDKKKYKATIVGTDPTTDLAVIKIEATELPILDLADSDEARVGEWVLAVGNPMNLTSTVTAGIVSAKGRNINLLDRNKAAIESFIQTDAAVNPGNSGGALVDVNGKLLGINVAIASETGSYTGYSFAIPANLVKKVVEDIVEYGAPQRGFLGVNIQDMDADLSKEKNINLTNGVYVDRVVEGGSAEKAGVKSGDVIVGINGKTIDTSAELQEMVGRGRPGDSFSLTVNRKGKNQNIDVRLTRGATRE